MLRIYDVGIGSMTSLRSPRRALIDFMIRHLVKERQGYVQRFPFDLQRLRAVLQPGDVILVEGSQRISEVIKYLTQSSWSHAALYVGDALLRNGGPRADALAQRYREDASSLLVEATVETGVAAAPLSKYAYHNIRICRPLRLREQDLAIVLATVVDQIGRPYNVDHVLDLMRYFFPVHLIPQLWRQTALKYSGRFSKEVICSTQIAMAFQKIRYPILPVLDGRQTDVVGNLSYRYWLRAPWRTRQMDMFHSRVFRPSDPLLMTPRDFDLSPYFEIVKLPVQARREFDYKRITWADEEAVPTTGEALEDSEPSGKAA